MCLFRYAAPLLIAALMAALPSASNAQIAIGVSVTVAPPPLPVYDQPPLPGPGYIWTPGYWAWGDDDYYWVPGTWVEPPTVGLLWTPGYWGWSDGAYVWHGGYWGPHIGYYGGISYGFGYVGVGYEGGYWDHGVFSYNRTVNNFGSTTITNVYSKTVINNTAVTNVSYNGGAGGTNAKPTSQEEAAAHEQHAAPTPTQTQHQQAAVTNQVLRASVNHGKPAIAATAKPGEFSGHNVIGAKDVKATGTLPNATPGSGQHPLDAHKLPVPGSANPDHSTTLGTLPKTLGTPTGSGPTANPAPATTASTTHKLDAHKLPVPGTANPVHSTTLGTPPKTLGTPRGSGAIATNPVPATTAITPHKLDAHKGPGPAATTGSNQFHPVNAAKLSAPPPKPPAPHPAMRAAMPHPAAPRPVTHGGPPPKRPNG